MGKPFSTTTTQNKLNIFMKHNLQFKIAQNLPHYQLNQIVTTQPPEKTPYEPLSIDSSTLVIANIEDC